MRIGILNLPLDNNYGGNLQRYALIKVLQNMGYDVEHICLVRKFLPPCYILSKTFIKQGLRKLKNGTNMPIMYQVREHREYWRNVKAISKFYNAYIPHTRKVFSYQDIDTSCYDAVIVGSDQVWRKSMVPYFGLENFFLGFVPNPIKKIGYGVCIGNYEEWTNKDKKSLLPLYNRLNALSVREYQSIEFLEQNSFNTPKPQRVLDPTLLLDNNNYNELIINAKTHSLTVGRIFAYILDSDDQITTDINNEADKRALEVYMQNLNNSISIEQWIRNIKDSKLVITDSYHGVVFSLIFQKPFIFKGNERRGNVRIDSLLSLFKIDRLHTDEIDYQSVYNILIEERMRSLNFIKHSLDS